MSSHFSRITYNPAEAMVVLCRLESKRGIISSGVKTLDPSSVFVISSSATSISSPPNERKTRHNEIPEIHSIKPERIRGLCRIDQEIESVRGRTSRSIASP